MGLGLGLGLGFGFGFGLGLVSPNPNPNPDPNQVDALSAVVNQPQFVLSRLRQLGQASSVAGVTEKEREMLFKSIAVLGDCVSTCERIYNTPIPLAYSRHTSRFLVIYVSTLPLVLVGALRWVTLPVMLTVCWALFGILEIGNLVEEPFTAVVSSTSVLMHLLPLTEVRVRVGVGLGVGVGVGLGLGLVC